MGIISAIVIGLLIGVVAKFLMPGKDPAGCIITIILGILGATVATYIGQALGWYIVGEPAGFIASVFGAMLLLFVYRLTLGKRG